MEVTGGSRTIVTLLLKRVEILFGLFGEELRDHMTILVDDPLRGAKCDQLVCLEVNGNLGGNLFGIDAEAFASDGKADR